MTEQIVNPLLQQLRARIPGETFRLPSLGLFYKNGELDESVQNGEVHVYPLTTIDEIVLGTPDKLLNGKAVEEVFSRCIPQIKKPMYLLQKDVDFLLSALRLLSYGPTMTMTYKHTCKNAREHQYDIDLNSIVAGVKYVDPTSLEHKYKITIGTGQTITFHPPVFKNVVEFYQTLTFNKENVDENDEAKMQDHLMKTYANLINDVDGITDKNMIIEWLKALPTDMFKTFADSLHVVGEWGLKTRVKRKCVDCNEEIELDANTNPISFFL